MYFYSMYVQYMIPLCILINCTLVTYMSISLQSCLLILPYCECKKNAHETKNTISNIPFCLAKMLLYGTVLYFMPYNVVDRVSHTLLHVVFRPINIQRTWKRLPVFLWHVAIKKMTGYAKFLRKEPHLKQTPQLLLMSSGTVVTESSQ